MNELDNTAPDLGTSYYVGHSNKEWVCWECGRGSWDYKKRLPFYLVIVHEQGWTQRVCELCLEWVRFAAHRAHLLDLEVIEHEAEFVARELAEMVRVLDVA